MSLRWKFLIVLLLFSLGPLLAYAVVGQQELIRLGENISDLWYRHRTLSVSRELELLAREYARNFSREKDSLELVLTIFAKDVERALAEEPRAASRIRSNSVIRELSGSRTGLVQASDSTGRAVRDGAEPMSVGRWHRAFRSDHVADDRQAGKDVLRLQRLIPLHNILEDRLGQIFSRQYAVLRNGVYAAYPVRNGDPPVSNLIEQVGSVINGDDGRVVWSVPHRDRVSGQGIISAWISVSRPDGSFAGIAAMEGPISGLLQATYPSSVWAEYVRSFLVRLESNPETGALGLKVLATKDSPHEAAVATSALEPKWLLSFAKGEMTWLAREFQATKSGYFDMPYEGRDSIFAYASSGKDPGFILVVPKEKVLIEAQFARDGVLRLTDWQGLEAGVITVAVVLVLTLIAFWRSRALVRPFLVMAEAVQRLAQGDFSARMEIEKGDERDLVARAFNDMVPQLEDRIRIRKALETAQEVQQNLLPDDIPELPGFDITAKSLYCDETGGDYFDFVRYGKDFRRLGIAVGDVTGHGVGAALLMATARAYIRSLSTREIGLAEQINTVNSLLTSDARQTGNFVSLFFLELQAGSRLIRWVRAGHDPAFLLDPATNRFEELSGSGLVLGIEATYSYTQNEKYIESPGTIIVIGTDGIWETHNGSGEMFGKQRVLEVIRRNAEKPAREIQDSVLEAVSEFRGDERQQDDITVAVVKLI